MAYIAHSAFRTRCAPVQKKRIVDFKLVLKDLPDVGANKILERVILEGPQFYVGILERFSQAVTEINFRSAVPPFQMLRILLALLEYRFTAVLTFLISICLANCLLKASLY